MKIFISGKIDGNPAYKRDFKKAELFLKLNDQTPINPAKILETVDFLDYIDLLEFCYKLISTSDAVFFLKNWKESNGSRLEHAFAVAIGKDIIYEK